MKFAIISDTHDNLPNIYKVLDFLKKEKIKIIIHCGDVCAPSVLKEMAEKFNGEIHLAYGNVDGDHKLMEKIAKEELNNVKIYGAENGEIEIKGFKVAFTHYPDLADKLAETGKYNLVFHGHTHKPWEKKVDNTRILNPGTLAGLFAKATFAIYDTETSKAELKLVEGI